jgi:putative endonuclease
MNYVYLLRSVNQPRQRYVGSTENLRQRLEDHNEGKSIYTARYRPWALVTYVAFGEKEQALKFERYLKVGSGPAFARRHLWYPFFPLGYPHRCSTGHQSAVSLGPDRMQASHYLPSSSFSNSSSRCLRANASRAWRRPIQTPPTTLQTSPKITGKGRPMTALKGFWLIR